LLLIIAPIFSDTIITILTNRSVETMNESQGVGESKCSLYQNSITDFVLISIMHSALDVIRLVDACIATFGYLSYDICILVHAFSASA
jgi:hypothetical protein